MFIKSALFIALSLTALASTSYQGRCLFAYTLHRINWFTLRSMLPSEDRVAVILNKYALWVLYASVRGIGACERKFGADTVLTLDGHDFVDPHIASREEAFPLYGYLYGFGCSHIFAVQQNCSCSQTASFAFASAIVLTATT